MEHHHDHDHGHLHGVHGMLVLGGQRTDTAMRSPVYVSHLPMFSSPHDFQVILRVGGEAARVYGDFVAHFGFDPIFTFMPEPFSIDELDPSSAGGPARTSFGGTLFRGHFERGGSEIASDVPFEVEQAIHYRRFRSEESPDEGPLRYLCFGQRDAAFLAHLVEAPPPDFDQILQVELGGADGASDEQLRDGIVVQVPDRTDEIEERLQPGETFSAEPESESGDGSAPVEVTVSEEYYFETGDLAAA
jgi:hypothetical protein